MFLFEIICWIFCIISLILCLPNIAIGLFLTFAIFFGLLASIFHANRKNLSKSNAQIASDSKLPVSKTQSKERINFYNKCSDLPSDFVILDTETTGFNPSTEHLIQIACIKVSNNEITDTFNEYIKPPILIPAKIQKLTGITNELVENSGSVSAIIPKLVTFIGNNTIICHNASFDMSFLQTNLNSLGLDLLNNQVVDTLVLARKLIKNVENHKLETLKKHLNIDTTSHNALNDCNVTLKLYQHCKELSKNNDSKTDVSDITKNHNEIELNELENEYFSIVKQILTKNNRDISPLDVYKTSIYFNISLFDYNFLRFKTTNRLKYWLAEAKQQDILKIDSDVNVQEGRNDEIKYVRVFLKNPQDLKKYTKIILNNYDQLCESKRSHDEWVAEGKPMHYECILKVNSDKTVTIEQFKY